MRSGTGRHRRPRQAPALVVTAGVTGAGIALPLLGAASAQAVGVDTWERAAECETGGAWSGNPGNGYYGGLNLTLGTWQEYGGTEFAERPDLASRAQQIAVGERILADQGRQGFSGCAVISGLWQEHREEAAGSPESEEPEATDGSRERGGEDAPGGPDVPDASGADGQVDGDEADGDGARDAEDADGRERPGGDRRGEAADPDGSAESPEPPDSRGPSDARPGEADGSAEAGAGAEESSGEPGTGRHRGDPDPAEAERGAEPGGGRHADRAGGGAGQERAEGAEGEEGADGAEGAEGAESPAAPAERGAYEVRRGDTLSAIADAHAVPGGWPALYEANEAVVGADPDHILPGQVLAVDAPTGPGAGSHAGS